MTMAGGWAESLRELYRQLDAEIAESTLNCSGCGACCHFEAVDHILYASELERRFLTAMVALPPQPKHTEALILAGLRCPFQIGHSCAAREARVLGCRLHYCRWEDSERESLFYERWHTALKGLHDSLGVPWDYRPLFPLQR